MAFTAPTTRATDYLVTAAVWNAEHVDNFNTAVLHLAARKSADQTVTNSIVLVNDNHLSLAVGANDVWLTRWSLFYTASTAAIGIRLAWSFPASGNVHSTFVAANASSVATLFTISGTSNPSTALQLGAHATGSDLNGVPIDLLFVNSSTAGTLQLQWAQTTANGAGTTLKANSTLWAVKLA